MKFRSGKSFIEPNGINQTARNACNSKEKIHGVQFRSLFDTYAQRKCANLEILCQKLSNVFKLSLEPTAKVVDIVVWLRETKRKEAYIF